MLRSETGQTIFIDEDSKGITRSHGNVNTEIKLVPIDDEGLRQGREKKMLRAMEEKKISVRDSHRLEQRSCRL